MKNIAVASHVSSPQSSLQNTYLFLFCLWLLSVAAAELRHEGGRPGEPQIRTLGPLQAGLCSDTLSTCL